MTPAKATLRREPKEGFAALKLRQGEALFRIAEAYPRLLDVVLEEVQNCLDAEAKRIHLVINFKTRSLAIRDDGEGTTPEKFHGALTQVCLTMKDKTKLGQFGIGLVSPLGKCEKFTFTSTPKSNASAYVEWTFVCDDIRVQADDIQVPETVRKDLVFSRDGSAPRRKTGVTWRTSVEITGFKKDAILSRVSRESLTESIVDRFNAAMLRNNSVISVTLISADGESRETWDIKPQKFRGQPLKELLLRQGRVETTFRLFLARKSSKSNRKSRTGRVLIGEAGNDYRFDIATFWKNTPAEYLPEEAIGHLASGIFEGEIVVSGLELHPSRKMFYEGDALYSLGLIIELWYRDIGSKYVREVQERRKEERYQELGRRSLMVIEGLISTNPQFQSLLESFRIGSIGVGHADPDAKRLGKQDEKSLVAGLSKSTNGNSPSERQKNLPEEERESHHPFSSIGPKGTRRTMVRGNSLGLQFSYEGAEGTTMLYELDDKRGILHFNVRHPVWQRCEEAGDQSLMRLQEVVAIWALVEHITSDLSDTMREQIRVFGDEFFAPYSFALSMGDMLAGRKPGKKPRK